MLTLHSKSKLPWQKNLVRKLKTTMTNNSFWGPYLEMAEQASVGIHLAVFVEPYLTYLLGGQKTVESRFSVHRIAPFNSVSEGDIVILKKASGPIVGLCQVTNVWDFKLEPKTWREIRNDFTEALCAQDPMFWDQRKHASYATLMRVKNVAKVPPIAVSKRDRRGWVVLKRINHQRTMFEDDQE